MHDLMSLKIDLWLENEKIGVLDSFSGRSTAW